MNKWYEQYEEADDSYNLNPLVKYTDDQIKYFERILNNVAKSIAYPDVTITDNDKLKAMVVINKLSDDMNMIDYLYSRLTIVQHEKIKQIP